MAFTEHGCGRRLCGGLRSSVKCSCQPPFAVICNRGHHREGDLQLSVAALIVSHPAGPLQAGAQHPATRPDGKPPEVFAPPRAYGFVSSAARRRGGFGAAVEQACSPLEPMPGGTAVWGVLHWGSPTGSAVHTLDGTVESAKSWRDEVSWWHASARARPEAGAPGSLPAACSWGRLWRPARNGVGNQRADGAPAARAPSLPPTAPLDGEVGLRVVIAMELCEAGARTQAPHSAVLHRRMQAVSRSRVACVHGEQGEHTGRKASMHAPAAACVASLQGRGCATTRPSADPVAL
jgi:hypothetical protein